MSESFNGWTQGVWFYGPVLGLGLLLVFLGLFILWFFRDFSREITAAPLEIVSPADGKVVGIEDFDESPYYEGPTRRVSVFMSIFDAHVNRAPFDGTVTRVAHKNGRYKNAMNPESSQVNESNAVYLDTAHGPITVRQIAGAVARRIVCVAETGTEFEKGEKFGMIRLGSRAELYLPPGTEVCVNEGEQVYAGSSVLAKFQ